MLTFSSLGAWVYGLSSTIQEHMKKIIAGKTKQEAMQLLTSLKGIKSASAQWDEYTKLPTDIRHIHFIILIPNR